MNLVGWRGVAGLVSVLLIGVAVGVGLDRALLLHAGGEHTLSHEEIHAELMHDLDATVHLTDEQAHDIERIIRHHQARIDETWDMLRPNLEVAIDSLRRQVELTLRPDQVASFNAWWDREHGRTASLPEMHR